MEINERDAWVAEKLEAVRPEWRPDLGRARALLARGEAAPEKSHAWRWVAVCSAGVLTIALALPGGLVKAQELWQRVMLRSFSVVRLDLSKVPLEVSVTSNGATREVTGMEEAARLAGFQPLLPEAQSARRTVVTGPMSVTQVVRVGPLRAALRKAGAYDVEVPDSWEGLELRMDLAPLVITEYMGDAQIIQSRPVGFRFPATIEFERFAAAVFRGAGVQAWQASLMARKFALNPAWLLDVPEDEAVIVEEIAVGRESGLLVEDPKEEGGSRVTVMFGAISGTRDRIFAVSSDSRETSLRLARGLAAM
jgi:hypothetical protein